MSDAATGASRHFVLAAGGTGGHLVPAYALADELVARGHHVALITDERGSKIPGKPAHLTSHVLPAGRMSKNPIKLLKGLRGIMAGRSMALRLFESFQPTAVVGFGGYPSLPTLLAARSANIPAVIHEQNAVMGRVNRFLAGGVDAIATSYAETRRMSSKHLAKVEVTGNPVRAELLELRDEPFPPLGEDSLLRVLVTGGSQGARVLSEVVPDGLAMLPNALRSRLQVVQQCRPEDIEAVRERYASHEIPAELGTFFEDMQDRLARAHLFIGRAGASTIAELTTVGRPAILIPLPFATDDHQSANAQEIVKAGGARVIRQNPRTTLEADSLGEMKRNALLKEQSDLHQQMAKQLSKQMKALAERPEALANAAHAAWNCGHPKAAQKLADLVESFGGDALMDVIRVGDGSAAEASTQVRGATA